MAELKVCGVSLKKKFPSSTRTTPVVLMVTVHPWLADISQPGAFNLGHVRDSAMYLKQHRERRVM